MFKDDGFYSGEDQVGEDDFLSKLYEKKDVNNHLETLNEGKNNENHSLIPNFNEILIPDLNLIQPMNAITIESQNTNQSESMNNDSNELINTSETINPIDPQNKNEEMDSDQTEAKSPNSNESINSNPSSPDLNSVGHKPIIYNLAPQYETMAIDKEKKKKPIKRLPKKKIMEGTRIK